MGAALIMTPMMERGLCEQEMDGSLWSLRGGPFMGVLGGVFPEDKDLGGGLRQH